ncbi:MAG TPA: DUF2062 domain-containing protein [Mucilaginibacter sp.]|nr:DUF2062 domain-containing protein [Mucilaginibacter sp.]
MSDIFFNQEQSDLRKSLSAAFGIFMGIIPVWGLQTLIAVSLAAVFRLNKGLVLLFSQVSFPPLLPVIILLSYRVGRYFSTDAFSSEATNTVFLFGNFDGRFGQYLYGSIVLAFTAAITTGFITFFMLRILKITKQHWLSLQNKQLTIRL